MTPSTLIAHRAVEDLLGDPVPNTAAGAARSQPQQRPRPIGGAFENDVSYGSDRFQVIPSRIQRTEQYRDSSIPSLLVGAGSGSHLVAAACPCLR